MVLTHNVPATWVSCSLKGPTCSYFRDFALAASSAKNSLLLESPLRHSCLFRRAFPDPNQCYPSCYSAKLTHNCCLYQSHYLFISLLALRPIKNITLFIYLLMSIKLKFCENRGVVSWLLLSSLCTKQCLVDAECSMNTGCSKKNFNNHVGHHLFF